MTKTLVAAFSLLVSSMAVALPAPAEIEAAVNAGHLSQAEDMVREVIREKPGSAKARYELGQILAREGRNADARSELLEAQRLDPALKFASDPQHFRDLLSRIPSDTAKLPVRGGSGERPAATASFPLYYVLIGGGALLVVWLMSRRRTTVQAPPLASSAPSGYAPGPGPVGGSGTGVGGALMGGAAGLAAGYGLAKLLEDREGGSASAHVATDRPDLVDSTRSPADLGAFDSGTGDSWDSAGSSGGDDSW
jgi:hypothetical protein